MQQVCARDLRTYLHINAAGSDVDVGHSEAFAVLLHVLKWRKSHDAYYRNRVLIICVAAHVENASVHFRK